MDDLFGVVDIGSNALRWSIGVPYRHAPASTPPQKYAPKNSNLASYGPMAGGFHIVMRGRAPLRLGEEVFLGMGSIPQEKVQALIDALQEFQRETKRHGVHAARIVATSAMREATNSAAVLEQVYEATGLTIEIIEGVEEARLVQVAIAHELSLEGSISLLVDIGGGSVEVTLCDNGQVLSSHSVKVGGVRLLSLLRAGTSQQKQTQTQTLETSRGIKLVERVVRQFTDRHIGVLQEELRHRAINCLVGTGGSLESIAVLRVSLLGAEDASELTAAEVKELKAIILSTPFEERITKLQLRRDRADVIVPAIIMIDTLMEALNIPTVKLPRLGLREGVLLELANSHEVFSTFQVSVTQLRTVAVEMGRRYHFNEQHALTVARHATSLFDTCAPLHKLNDEARVLLELGAILHDIGYCVDANGHHKHSQYLIAASPFFGLSPRQRNLVAQIARYHRKAKPSPKHDDFRALNDKDKDLVRMLAALLRVADACDRDHEDKVQSINITIDDKVCTLDLVSNLDVGLEEWAITQKKGLFEEIFRLKLIIGGSPASS